MLGNTNTGYTDKEKMTDALSSQKFITGNYNNAANECVSDSLKNCIMNILNDEHQIQHDVFSEMQRRGWYQVVNAEPQKIQDAKNKFSAS